MRTRGRVAPLARLPAGKGSNWARAPPQQMLFALHVAVGSTKVPTALQGRPALRVLALAMLASSLLARARQQQRPRAYLATLASINPQTRPPAQLAIHA
jgi:hypothetical protein